MRQKLSKLAVQHECKIHTKVFGSQLLATYTYRWDAEAGCRFTLLGEVAESLQETFAAIMRERGLRASGTRQTEDSPYVQDFLEPDPDTPAGRRWVALMPGMIPRWVRCYGNGGGLEWSCPKCPRFYDKDELPEEDPSRCECGAELRQVPEGQGSADCYTVCFTGKAGSTRAPGYPAEYCYRAMSAHPYHPQGIGMWGSVTGEHCDIEKGGWPVALYRTGRAGKRIAFTDLPEDCQRCVINDYTDIWNL